jgi:hypothetical protein
MRIRKTESADGQSWTFHFSGIGSLRMQDANEPTGGTHTQVRYWFRPTGDSVLFSGADYAVPSHEPIDSRDAALSLMSFLTLQPGDTDAEYFARHTADQLAWVASDAADRMRMELYERGDRLSVG